MRAPTDVTSTRPLSSTEHKATESSGVKNIMDDGATSNNGTGHRVELANLLLPAFDENDDNGSQVVLLEARFETCSDLLESSQAQIQAVVDLDKLSEIVGLSRDQFLIDLHNQVNEQLQLNSHVDESEMFLDAEQETIAVNAASAPAEYTFLLPQSMHPKPAVLAPPHAVSDRIAFVANAFVDTLTEVLPEAATIDDDSHNAYFDSIESLPDRTLPLQTHAFLLEMPTSCKDATTIHTSADDATATPHPLTHFILALPADNTALVWDDNVSEASDTSFLHGVSFLPSDVQDVQIEATTIPIPMDYAYNDDDMLDPYRRTASNEFQKQRPYPNGIRLDVVVKRRVPLIGYVILVTGLWALSSVGVALNWQGHNVSPLLKTYWRLASTALVLLPMAMHSMKASGGPHKQLTTQTQWLLLVTASACYAFMCAAFVLALDLTTVVNAFVLSDLAPLFLILGRWIVGLPVLYTEGLGAAIGFLGGAICATDKSSSSSMELNVGGEITTSSTMVTKHVSHPNALTGDALAILASAATVVYLLIAKKLRPHIDLFMFMFLLMLMASFFLLVYMVLEGEDIRLSNDPNNGLWGWVSLTPDRLPLEIYLAIVCNVLGTTGYVAVMKYFEPVVVSTVMLMEPVLGALMGVAAGLDPLPGLQTWVGDGVVTVGIILVVWSGARTTETIDATDALLQIGADDDKHANGGGGGGSGVPLLMSPVVTTSVSHRRKLQLSERRESSIE